MKSTATKTLRTQNVFQARAELEEQSRRSLLRKAPKHEFLTKYIFNRDVVCFSFRPCRFILKQSRTRRSFDNAVEDFLTNAVFYCGQCGDNERTLGPGQVSF